MKKYDIGILTFWNVPNYGTYAQAYALQKVIQSICPNKNVRQIAHLDERHYNFYFNQKAYLRSFPIWKKAFWRSFFVKEKDIQGKEKIFFEAYDKIPHTESIDKKNVSRYMFEKVILGSDIVWDFTLKPFNHDHLLFGKGFNAKEVCSYAASFGTVTGNTIIPNYVSSSLLRMKHVLVRDTNSVDIVKKITGHTPEIVLDPVWLWDFQNDENVVVPNEENYILVYGQDFSERFIENLMKYAKDKKLKTIVLDCNDDNYTWCDKLVKQEELDPLSWIGYFKGASAVATSTFHGLTFALLFNKRIAFCKTEFILAKIEGLLKELCIYELFDDKDDVPRMLDYEWNYDFINKVVNSKKEKSIKLLKEACE